MGYRVHAHIYNLSERRRTVLIEEDGRGTGVDDTLGLRGLKAFAPYLHLKPVIGSKGRLAQFAGRVLNRIHKRWGRNPDLLAELEDYLDELEANDYKQMEWAFERMQYYYQSMQAHLGELKKLER